MLPGSSQICGKEGRVPANISAKRGEMGATTSLDALCVDFLLGGHGSCGHKLCNWVSRYGGRLLLVLFAFAKPEHGDVTVLARATGA